MHSAMLSVASCLAQSSNGGGAGLFAGMGILVLLLWGVGILATIFWVWMLIDCVTSPMPAGEKILWFLVIFFLHLLGAAIYYIARRSSRGRPAAT